MPWRCDGTTDQLRLAVGIMSRPTNEVQRIAVRDTWAGTAPASVLHCFLVGAVVKRTPRAPWDKRRAEEMAEADGGPKGEISANPALSDWYDYDVVTHTLSPKDTVFVVRTAHGDYVKLKIGAYEDGVFDVSWVHAGAGRDAFEVE